MNAQTEDLIITEAIEAVLRESTMGLTVAEIADDVGASAVQVKNSLRALNAIGRIDLIPAKTPTNNRYRLLSRRSDTDSEGGEMDIQSDDVVDAEMPPADPALLASANRMLSERLAGVAHALRGSGLEGLKDLDDGADLQPAVAALTGAYQMALARIDDLQQDMVDVADLDSGYIVTASKRKPRKTMNAEKAIAAARSAIKAGAQRADVYALVPIGRAVRGAEWKPA